MVCAVLAQDLIGHIVNAQIGGINALPTKELFELFHHSSSTLVACKTSPTDAAATPGKGYCGPAAARIIKHWDPILGYGRPSLEDIRYCGALRSSCGAIQGNLKFHQQANTCADTKAICVRLSGRLKRFSDALKIPPKVPVQGGC
jgi:hypothetical protein